MTNDEFHENKRRMHRHLDNARQIKAELEKEWSVSFHIPQLASTVDAPGTLSHGLISGDKVSFFAQATIESTGDVLEFRGELFGKISNGPFMHRALLERKQGA